MLVREAWPDDERRWKYWVWLRECCLRPEAVASIPRPRWIEEAELTQADIDKLIEYSYISVIAEISPTQATSTIKVFTVLEKNGSRRRVIFHPSLINGVLLDAGFGEEHDVSLPCVSRQISAMQGTEGAMCVDGTAFYTQFPSTDDPFSFVFSFDGKFYRPTSISTGQRQCVALAQVVLEALAAITNKVFPHVVITSYIDNARFAGGLSVCNDAWTLFRRRAEEAKLTFEVQSTWAARYTFLGILYDHQHQSVQLGERATTKLRFYLTCFIRGDFATWTMQDCISLFGLLVWGSSVLCVSPASRYWIYKFLRRRSSKLLTDPCDVWPSIIRLLEQWIFEVLHKVHSLSCSATEGEVVHVYSDASLDGHGVVVYVGSRCYVSAGCFSRLENIAHLEGRAWLKAVHFTKLVLGDAAKTASIIFYIDNTSIIGAVANGHSRNYIINCITIRLSQAMKESFGAVSVLYVKSSANHADYYSRLIYNTSMCFTTHQETTALSICAQFAGLVDAHHRNLPCAQALLAVAPNSSFEEVAALRPLSPRGSRICAPSAASHCAPSPLGSVALYHQGNIEDVQEW